MRALASATKLVPYDSALFVLTDKGAGDPQRLPLALRVLVEKRLKVSYLTNNIDAKVCVSQWRRVVKNRFPPLPSHKVCLAMR